MWEWLHLESWLAGALMLFWALVAAAGTLRDPG